jgi:hypothetical protein
MNRSDLTTAEQTNVKTALAFLRARCGGLKPLAKALRFSTKTLRNPPGPVLVFRLARLAGVSIDDVLTGKFPEAGVCPHCGMRKEEAAAAE